MSRQFISIQAARDSIRLAINRMACHSIEGCDEVAVIALSDAVRGPEAAILDARLRSLRDIRAPTGAFEKIVESLPGLYPCPPGARGSMILVFESVYRIDWYPSTEDAALHWISNIENIVETCMWTPGADDEPAPRIARIKREVLDLLKDATISFRRHRTNPAVRIVDIDWHNGRGHAEVELETLNMLRLRLQWFGGGLGYSIRLR